MPKNCALMLGLIGSNGAGKSTACTFFKNKGFRVFSLSNVIREICDQTGLEKTRENLIATANQLKQTEGDGVLAKKALDFTKADTTTPIVFDSIRNESECQILRENGVTLIGIDAPIEIRWKRTQSRNDTTDNVDFETFKRFDDIEMSGKSTGQNIQKALDYCTYRLVNDRDEHSLHVQLDEILTHLCQD